MKILRHRISQSTRPVIGHSDGLQVEECKNNTSERSTGAFELIHKGTDVSDDVGTQRMSTPSASEWIQNATAFGGVQDYEITDAAQERDYGIVRYYRRFLAFALPRAGLVGLLFFGAGFGFSVFSAAWFASFSAGLASSSDAVIKSSLGRVPSINANT